MVKSQNPVFLMRRLKHIWIHGFVLGLGIMLIGFLVWFSLSEKPSAPPSEKGKTAPQVQTQSDLNASVGSQAATKMPADPTMILKNQLEQVLERIKEANQNKNLSQFLSQYSPNFPHLAQKAQRVSRAWKIYDYRKMEFEIKDIKPLAANITEARVTWEVEAQNSSTLKRKVISKTYLVRFVRDSGHWRIKAVDETG
jgi:hypothetical protein